MAEEVKRNEKQEIECSFAFRITPESSQLPHQLQTNWISVLKVIAINPHSDSGTDSTHLGY
jgi:hypothetical protein